MTEIKEGYLPFGQYRTYYRIAGKNFDQKPPLILLHGGPGSTHNYFEVLDCVADKTNRQVIMYDQLAAEDPVFRTRLLRFTTLRFG